MIVYSKYYNENVVPIVNDKYWYEKLAIIVRFSFKSRLSHFHQDFLLLWMNGSLMGVYLSFLCYFVQFLYGNIWYEWRYWSSSYSSLLSTRKYENYYRMKLNGCDWCFINEVLNPSNRYFIIVIEQIGKLYETTKKRQLFPFIFLSKKTKQHQLRSIRGLRITRTHTTTYT